VKFWKRPKTTTVVAVALMLLLLMEKKKKKKKRLLLFATDLALFPPFVVEETMFECDDVISINQMDHSPLKKK
jgi:hypothetical protein